MKEIDYSKKLTINNWSVSDRPREKYMEKGFQALTDAELIAILIRNGSPEESAVDLGIKLLKMNKNSLNALADMALQELMNVRGIGEAKAISIKAAFELGQRRRADRVASSKKITLATDIVELMQDKIANIVHEEFWVLFINQGSTILKIENFSRGGLTSSVVDPRLIIKKALEYNATGIFLCHNHPSGNMKPSREDLSITQKIGDAVRLFDITLVDHLILHKDKYYSFAAEGKLL